MNSSSYERDPRSVEDREAPFEQPYVAEYLAGAVTAVVVCNGRLVVKDRKPVRKRFL